MTKSTSLKFFYYSLVLSLLTLLVLKKVYDYDIWYHLTIGREIFRTWHIPATEFFVYPQLGEPVSFHEWGFGLFFYLAFRWFGYLGMGIANALLGGVALFFFYLAAENRRRNYCAALLLVPLFWLVDFRLIYRPEMVFFLFLGIEIFVLERFSAEGSWKWLYTIPLLTFLLNLFHPSALFLLIVLGAYTVQFLYEAYRQQDLSCALSGKLAGIFLLAFLSSALNPYGFQQTLLPISFVQSAEYLQKVVEFTPTFQTPLKTQFIGLAVCGTLALLFQPRRRIVDWLLFFFFGYLGFRYVRNVALFAFITYLPVARVIGTLAQRIESLRSAMGKKVVVGCVLAALSATVISVIGRETWGVGSFSDRFPEKAANIITELKPPGQLFNAYNMGGYLSWQLYDNYLVSIDGRHYSLDKSFILGEQVFQAKPGWQKVLADYKVSTIFTPATSPFTGVLVDLLAQLDGDEEWILVSAEPSGLLFMRREALPMTKGWQMPDQNETWRQVIREAGSVPVSPGHADPYLATSIAYFYLHKVDESAAYLRKYLALVPGDAEAAKNLAVMERGGRFDPAAAPASSKTRIF